MIINLLATWIPALGIAFLGVLKLLGNFFELSWSEKNSKPPDHSIAKYQWMAVSREVGPAPGS